LNDGVSCPPLLALALTEFMRCSWRKLKPRQGVGEKCDSILTLLRTFLVAQDPKNPWRKN
jgi:hypothetical protein